MSTSSFDWEIFYVGVYCDAYDCPAEDKGDYQARTIFGAYEALRGALRAQGWQCNAAGDYCPEHVEVDQ
jgi:hypothetical protein